jgi:translation initiation factor IF-3
MGYISFPYQSQHKKQQKLQTSGDTQVDKLNFTREIEQENLEKKLESHSVTLLKYLSTEIFFQLVVSGV